MQGVFDSKLYLELSLNFIISRLALPAVQLTPISMLHLGRH